MCLYLCKKIFQICKFLLVFPSTEDDVLCRYLGVFLVATVDLCDALLGAFSGGRGGEGLLHPAGTFPQTALDAEGLVQLVHLEAHTERLHLQ